MKEFRNKLIVHGLMKINDKYLVIKRSIIKRGNNLIFLYKILKILMSNIFPIKHDKYYNT